MPKLSCRKRTLMAACLVVATLAGSTSRARLGLSAEHDAESGSNEQKAGRYLGSKSCMLCHQSTAEQPSIFAKNEKTKDFILNDEYVTWSTKDKHRIAYDMLEQERGQQISKRLNRKATDPKTGCLGCHSASASEIQDREKQGDLFDVSEGVSCENCHGPSSGWTDHFNSTFRLQTRTEREAVGMIDLRTSASKAAQCLTCHIGNVGQGKVVTHEMYAAGHPPLPGIEVSTFVESIPRHWKLDGEKPAKIRQETRFKAGDREKTKLAIVGAAVALKTSLKLIADELRIPEETDVPGLGWPDNARFDCWSCHHDLRRESWRQSRGFDGAPGRVPLSIWPTVLVEIGIDYLILSDKSVGALRNEYDRHRSAMREPFNFKPFGQRATLAKAADEFIVWSEVLIQRLESATYDEPGAAKLLSMVVARALKSNPDHDTARHLAWTIAVLFQESDPKAPNHEAIQAILDNLDKGLNLSLPAGRDYQIEKKLPEALQVIGDYEPSQFRDQIQKLDGLLPLRD